MKFLLLLVILIGLLTNQRIDAALWNETYPKGEVLRNFTDYDVYSVGNKTSKLSMVVLYDIYGFNTSQTRVFCDRLASQYSAHVVMPDTFRGTVAPTGENRSAWSDMVGNWSRVSTDLINVANWLKTLSSEKQIGIIGFCWGGSQVVRACSNLSSLFFTGISIHGSRISADEVKQLKQPMLFIAAGNDPPLHPNISDAIAQANKNLSELCEYKTYSNMRHGFVAAGANYSNPENVQAIDDVHLTVRNFLTKILNTVDSITTTTTTTTTTTNNSVSIMINFYFLLILLIFSFHK